MIVLVGYGSNNNRLRMYEKFDGKSLVLSTVISADASGKQGEIKKLSVLIRLPYLLVP